MTRTEQFTALVDHYTADAGSRPYAVLMPRPEAQVFVEEQIGTRPNLETAWDVSYHGVRIVASANVPPGRWYALSEDEYRKTLGGA
jgi:hypothetical protein